MISNFFKHLHTVNKHRRLVRKGCFKVGLIKQGLSHDLSKYSPTEFRVGVKYYQGMRSPNVAERIEKGYSSAWIHHKGRNKHHYEYWTDYSIATANHAEPVCMPRKYFVEMIMDRIAACKVYKGKDYNDGAALDYFNRRDNVGNIHETTYNDLKMVLTMLKEEGEEKTFAYLKNVYLKDKSK